MDAPPLTPFIAMTTAVIVLGGIATLERAVKMKYQTSIIYTLVLFLGVTLGELSIDPWLKIGEVPAIVFGIGVFFMVSWVVKPGARNEKVSRTNSNRNKPNGLRGGGSAFLNRFGKP